MSCSTAALVTQTLSSQDGAKDIRVVGSCLVLSFVRYSLRCGKQFKVHLTLLRALGYSCFRTAWSATADIVGQAGQNLA